MPGRWRLSVPRALARAQRQPGGQCGAQSVAGQMRFLCTRLVAPVTAPPQESGEGPCYSRTRAQPDDGPPDVGLVSRTKILGQHASGREAVKGGSRFLHSLVDVAGGCQARVQNYTEVLRLLASLQLLTRQHPRRELR